MTQKFSSKLFGSNTLDTKRQYVWLSRRLLKNALQHEKGHNTVHLTHCNTWPFSDTRVKYERVTFCSLLLYISTKLLSFVYVTDSCISKLLKNFTNVLVTSITLSYTNATKCPLCSIKSSDIVLRNTCQRLCHSHLFFTTIQESLLSLLLNFVHSLYHSLHVIIFLRTPFIWTLSITSVLQNFIWKSTLFQICSHTMSEGLAMLITIPQSAQKLCLAGHSLPYSWLMQQECSVFVLAQFKQHPGKFLGFVDRGNNKAVCSSEQQTTSKMFKCQYHCKTMMKS